MNNSITLTESNVPVILGRLNEFAKGHSIKLLGFDKVYDFNVLNKIVPTKQIEYFDLQMRNTYNYIEHIAKEAPEKSSRFRGILIEKGELITFLTTKVIITHWQGTDQLMTVLGWSDIATTLRNYESAAPNSVIPTARA